MAHELAPAVPGIGKGALGPTESEISSGTPGRVVSVAALRAVTDEDVFAVVVRHFAPLPVLRHTCLAGVKASPWRPPFGSRGCSCLCCTLCTFAQRSQANRYAPVLQTRTFAPWITVPRLALPVPSFPLMLCGPCLFLDLRSRYFTPRNSVARFGSGATLGLAIGLCSLCFLCPAACGHILSVLSSVLQP